MRFSPIKLLAGATFIAVVLALIVLTLLPEPQAPQPRGQVTGTGAASIGGGFELTDHNSKVVRDTDFRGRYMLVYFGYTFCPDVCPTELQKITETMERLGKQAAKVQPLLITIDPERDTPAVLADYVSNFHPALIGLTGSLDQIKAVARAYRVYFKKSPADQAGDYSMDHSPYIYLMGPDGKYLYHFPLTAEPAEMAAKISLLIAGG